MHYYTGVVIKFIIGFTIVIVHMNLSGKTQLSQLTPVDFIGNFILGGIIGGVIYNDDIPLYQYIIVLIIGVGFITLLNTLSKKISIIRKMTMGKPIQIIKNGIFEIETIEKNKSRIDMFNFTSQIHAQGIRSLQEIYYARIEPSGQLTIFCNKKDIPSVIIIENENIIKNNLKDIGKDEEWVNSEIIRNKISLSDIFIAEYWNDEISFALKNGKFINKKRIMKAE